MGCKNIILYYGMESICRYKYIYIYENQGHSAVITHGVSSTLFKGEKKKPKPKQFPKWIKLTDHMPVASVCTSIVSVFTLM